MNSSRTDLASDPAAPPQRCSDAEREQTSSVVRVAAAEGRLSMEELEDRLTTIYAARYRHELAAVSADLPGPSSGTGWGAVLTLAWHQLSAELTGLFWRDRTAMSRRRKVVVALVLLAVVLLVIALVVQGFVDDGPEHEFGGAHEG
jgi:hypothetical protein